MKHWTDFLRTGNGSLEINRLVGFLGGVVYVIAANTYVGYEVLWLGRVFNIVEYCLAFPAGLATIVGGTAAAVSLKDRNVASSQVIRDTGVVPSKANAGPAGTAADPIKTEVVNTADNPANVTDSGGVDDRPSYAV